MSDVTASAAAEGQPQGRGRPRKPEIETPQQRVARLQAELRKAEAELAALEEKRALIIGKAVLAQAREDAGFRAELAALLRRRVKGKADLAVVAELFV